jgi:iron complex outermembrane receptor protein
MQTSKKNWNTLPVVLPVVCLLSSLTSIAAIAQEQAPEEDESFLEEVVVTGTRIKRRDFSSPSPLTTITREDFEFSGQPTLEGYLNQMPQVQPGFDRTANNPGDGTAQIDLRGMGPNRTLVLMNGRRLAPSGVGSAVDANNLPVALVDRVEIITGGASTVYGSDAVAGVVNFITRDDFEGLNLEGSYYLTEQGDAEIWDVNLVYGHELQGGDGNITVYAGLYEREALFAGDREITSIPWFDNWQGEVLPWGSTRTPAGRVRAPLADLGNGPVSVTFNPDGTPREFVSPDDLWNYAPVNYLQLPLTRKTVGVLGHFAISDNLEAYFEAAYTRNDIKQNLAPAPMEAFLFTNVDNPLWAPEMRPVLEQWEVEPGLAQMLFSRRMLELGNRIYDREREYTRLVAGVRGEIFNGWEMDAWTIYTKSDEVEIILNNGSVSRVQQALLVDPLTGQCFDTSSGCVPADVFGEARLSPEAVDYIRWQPLNNITSREQYLASIVITGSPFDIWTGPVDMAFGAEWRRDTVHFETDPILFSGDVMGINLEAPIDGKESVLEFYTEAIFTLFKSDQSAQKLDIEIGARWSDYANAGSVTTWKAGLDWRITPSWRVRAMAQHAVRAPNNSELFTQQNEFSWWFISDNLKDPCSASSDPAANGNVEKCLLQGLTQSQIGVFEATPFYPVDFISGGNPDLVPESSDTFTVGFVFTPISVPSLTIAVDYYDLEVTDTIGDVDVPLVCFDSKNSSGVFCDDVQRDASGNIAEIAELFQNRGLLATDGIDFQAQYLIELPDSLSLFDESAQLSISTIWTHVFSTKDQENVVTTVLECSGFFGWPCQGNDKVNPENRINTNFNYSAGPFTARLTWRWIDGMVNAAPKRSAVFGFPDPDLAIPDVDSWSYFDLGFSYQFGKSTTLRFVINNITDKKPAFMGSDFSNNTSASIYDVFGRSYQLSVSYQLGGN